MAIQALLVILAVLLVLLFLGVPISYAIAVSSLTAILSSIDLNVAVLTAAQRTFVGMSKFSLTAIPFFIPAGNIMNQGGIAKRLVDFGMQHYWQSHHPWIVPEPFTLEPTESFSKDDLDEFAAILKEISRECYEEPETIKSAPHNAPIHNTLLDEVMDFDKIAVTYRQLRKRMEAGTISKDILGQ